MKPSQVLEQVRWLGLSPPSPWSVELEKDGEEKEDDQEGDEKERGVDGMFLYPAKNN